MSDERCTWRLVDEEYVLYETSCSDFLMGSMDGDTLEEAGQTMCPECGKKIKLDPQITQIAQI